MIEPKQGDYVEWRYGRTVFRVDKVLKTDDPANDKAEISKDIGDGKRKVYTVSIVELYLVGQEFADKVSAINESMFVEEREHAEKQSSLRRQWQDLWELIHESREKSG